MRTLLQLSFCAIILLPFALTQADDAVKIISPPKNTTLSYTVGLISGEIADKDVTEVKLTNPRIHKNDEFVLGQAYQGKFKVLAPLRKGENQLTIKAGDAKTTFHLRYMPNENPIPVKIMYLTDSSGDIRFQTPEGLTGEDYAPRLATALKLMQTMTAERMNDLGYGRRTFNLELDENEEPIVHLVKGEKTLDEYLELWKADKWWGQYYHEMEKAFPKEESRVFIVTPFTRFDEKEQKTFAHAAVGGGRQAFFGGGTLYCWPTSIETACQFMLDTTRIDPKKITDDSIGRSVYWACAATCIGASLHEIGHSMGLPHSNDQWDIMTRGHDHFYRVFLVREAPSAHTNYERWTDYKSEEMSTWTTPSSSALIVSRWFSQKDPANRPRGKIEITVDAEKKIVHIEAENGIACSQGIIKKNGSVKYYSAPPPQDAVAGKFPKTLEIPFEEIRRMLGKEELEKIRVCDGNGFYQELRDVNLGDKEQ